jgi:hypothetical protein
LPLSIFSLSASSAAGAFLRFAGSSPAVIRQCIRQNIQERLYLKEKWEGIVLHGVFIFLLILSILGLILGLISPKLVIWWGDKERRTRGKAVLTYCIVLVVAIIGMSVSGPHNNTAPTTASKAQQSQVFKLNETATAGKLAYIVSEVKATKTIGTNQFLTKTTDNQYIVLKVKVTNNDNDARTIDTNLFSLTDGQGRKYSAMADADMYVNGQSSFFLQQVNPGTNASGYIVFETPPGITGLKLHCSSGLGLASGSEAVIDLGM